MTPSTVLAGLLFGFSLIVVIGAQNAFVLQQGALRRHVGAVVLICAASDVLLIAAGVAGMGAALQRWPVLLVSVRVLGAALLLAYAMLSARRAARPPAGGARAGGTARSLRAAIVACLAFTWLNPGVYLDTVVLLGSVADAHRSSRWSFATGAALASVAWFAALGFGARLLAPLLARDRAARSLDAFVAAVMGFTALRVLIAV